MAVVRKGSGWQARVTYVDDLGRRRTLSAVAKDKREAQRLERELYVAKDKGIIRTRGDTLTVAGYLEQWLGEQARSGLRPSTVKRYRELSAHVVTKAGAVPLHKLTTIQVRSVYASMYAAGLSNRTALHVHRLLHKALGDAVRLDQLERNVMDRVDAPRAERFEHHIVSRDELSRLFEAADKTEIGPLVHVLARTGLRLGEALGLRVCDIDLVAGKLRVEQSLDTRGRISRLKTARSRRTVMLSPETILILGDRLTEDPNARVFPWTQDAVRWTWRSVVRAESGIAAVRLHDIRHAHATMTIGAGVPVPVVSQRLGHSDPAVTMRFYAHVLPGADAELAARVDAVIGKGDAIEDR